MEGNRIAACWSRPVGIEPLLTFRILFGALMLYGALRFMGSGWIEKLYGSPKFFFKFYGFEWVDPLGVTGMYTLYGLMALGAAGIMLGLFYRASAVLFFATFSYAELCDATNYLNHYYLTALLGLILIALPAHRSFSLDSWRRPALKAAFVPRWTIGLLMVQIGLVYFFAGLAKLNPDWLFRAMPLAVWLPEHEHLPVLGALFALPQTAFLLSWAGAAYDLSIPFWLSWKKTRGLAYGAVLIFHGLTALLFNIGLFPLIMIFNTLIFFPAPAHRKWLGYLGYRREGNRIAALNLHPLPGMLLGGLLLFQLLFPLRHWLYPGNVLWTEEGYRFSWRVMLVEKAATAIFTVEDPASGRRGEVDNRRYLTEFQEKQMAIQPDFILQFAHFLAREYRQKYDIADPRVFVDSHVALNGRSSQRFIDPDIDLTTVREGWGRKEWVLPFNPQLP